MKHLVEGLGVHRGTVTDVTRLLAANNIQMGRNNRDFQKSRCYDFVPEVFCRGIYNLFHGRGRSVLLRGTSGCGKATL